MLTADPRIVPDVQVVPHLSFAEASELAYFGAKVLHPSTIQPAVGKNIPVRILNSRRPLDAAGTLITRDRPPSAHPLTAVASKKGVTVVDITSTRMLMAHGFLRRIFEAFEQQKTSVDVVTTSEVSVSVTIDDTRHLAESRALRGVAEITREDDMAIVCAVGDGLQTDPAFVGKLLDAVGVPIRMMSRRPRDGTSRWSSRGGSREDADARARALLRAGAGGSPGPEDGAPGAKNGARALRPGVPAHDAPPHHRPRPHGPPRRGAAPRRTAARSRAS